VAAAFGAVGLNDALLDTVWFRPLSLHCTRIPHDDSICPNNLPQLPRRGGYDDDRILWREKMCYPENNGHRGMVSHARCDTHILRNCAEDVPVSFQRCLPVICVRIDIPNTPLKFEKALCHVHPSFFPRWLFSDWPLKLMSYTIELWTSVGHDRRSSFMKISWHVHLPTSGS
jgi:hypothetical protein